MSPGPQRSRPAPARRLARRELLVGTLAAAAAACAAPDPAPATATISLPSRPRRVVVIGAGLAGLVVADELTRRGLDVVVLEAQSRPGGRILTLRTPLPEGLHVEAGATHVVGHADLLAVLGRHGVELVPRSPRPPDLASVVVAGGRRVRLGPDDEPPEVHALTEEERALGEAGRRARYLGVPEGSDPTGPWPPPALTRLDAMSVDAMLIERGASAGWRAGFAESGYGDGVDTVSAAFVLRDMEAMRREMEQGGGGRIAGGADRLPHAIARRLGDRVMYGAAVEHIEVDAAGARVGYTRGGVAESVEAARVVCAVPHTVLRHITFARGLSALKERAIAEVPMASVTRLFAQVRGRPWLAARERGTVDTDLALGRLRDETELLPGPDGVLGVYLSGAIARRVDAMPSEEQRRVLVEHLGQAHPTAVGGVSRVFGRSWDGDPWARGAYAWFRPGQMRELAPALAVAEGVLHFAGDHTSYRPGFMHGAVVSARRVVAEVLRARSPG